MKKSCLFLVFLLANMSAVSAQGLIIHKQGGLKDTVVVSTVDSITFTQSLVVHTNIGTKDSVLLSSIDSLTLDSSIYAGSIIKEDFETGSKGAYAAANVTLSTGVWNLSDALIGNTTADVRNGNAAVRVRNSGKITMLFDITSGAKTVTIQHAKYGTDASTTWQLWYSTDYGNNWLQTGSTVTTSAKLFETASFTLNITGLIRFEIRKTDGASARVNIDDISITTYGGSNTNPTPIIGSITPSSDTVGAGDLNLTVTGSNFIASSTVTWNAKNLATTYVSATELQAIVPAVNLIGAGTVRVGVYTPNGGYSSTVDFTIKPGLNGYVPAIRYISPQICTYGRAAFTLAVTGSNISPNSIVKWNDVPLATTYLSGTQLQAQVTAGLVANVGTANVSIYTPPPAGGTSSSRVFTINTGPLPSTNIHLTMGNPSSAVHDTNYSANYLVERGQYCMSYNRDRNLCNWISWELDTTWYGTAARGDFLTDNTLPAGWPRVSTNDYSGSGFNRGHMCPSADRTRSVADNDTVFLMSNIIPQTGPQNGGPWGSFEVACRDLTLLGNKVYIYCGVYGEGGVGEFGYATTIASGKIAVPSKTWKVAMVLPMGTDDLSRVTSSTRCIAVILENNQGPFNDWKTYKVSVDSVEVLTGYDFFSNVPLATQAAIESVVDSQ